MESTTEKRKQLHQMVDIVNDEDLDDLRWAIQQYAAKAYNKETEEQKN